MSIRVRKDEREKIVELLESGEYDSPAGLADAVFKLAAELLTDRETYAVGEGGIAWGVWFDERSAQKAAGAIGGRVARLYPSGALDRRLTALGEAKERGFCPGCKHPWLAHLDRPWREGKRKTGPMNPPRCCVDGCDCEAKEKAA